MLKLYLVCLWIVCTVFETFQQHISWIQQLNCFTLSTNDLFCFVFTLSVNVEQVSNSIDTYTTNNGFPNSLTSTKLICCKNATTLYELSVGRLSTWSVTENPACLWFVGLWSVVACWSELEKSSWQTQMLVLRVLVSQTEETTAEQWLTVSLCS